MSVLQCHTGNHAQLRHGRDRLNGVSFGSNLQPAPMLFTRDGHNVFFGDSYRGATAFLIGAGPSLCSHVLTALADRGVVTMAMNNAATVVRVRSNLRVSVDDPTHFVDAIWRDLGILKFVSLDHMKKPIAVREPDGNLILAADRAGDMPAVFGYRRNEQFQSRAVY